MARYEDYVKERQKQAGNLENEIDDAQDQQQTRQNDGTPDVDWETRYKELEKLNSRQAQTLGEYRKIVDNYLVTDPTPEPNNSAPEPESRQPITPDDFWDHPDEAVSRTVDSHPSVRKVEELERKLQTYERQTQQEQFATKHPDYVDIGQDPQFMNWVAEDPTRINLAQRADQYDFSAADALFSLYKAEKGLSQAEAQRRQQQEIDAAELESPTAGEPPAPKAYSRSEMLEMKIRAKQGDLEAERYVNTHAAAYREALASGNVRD